MTPSVRWPSLIWLSVPHMGGTEFQHVKAAFDQNWLSTVGPNLEALERRFAEIAGAHAVALASGTAALHLALRLLGVQDGDEVVTPTLSFVASTNPILYQGGVPVFIDSDYTSWNLDPNLLADFLKRRAARNRLPKAVIAVHLFGQAADMDPILATCNEYCIPVVEDAAEALGTQYKGRQVGAMGTIGAYSFNGNKIITSTGGGMLVSTDKAKVDKARYWSTQAREPGINYHHVELGYNYRMSNVLAGIALGQLDVLDLRVQQRRANAFAYRDALADIPGFTLMPQADYGLHTNWLSCFLIEPGEFGMDQETLISFLRAANIETRPVWKPMHLMPLHAKYECIGGKVAEDLNRRGICLPSSTSMTDAERNFVIDRIREAHRLGTAKV